MNVESAASQERQASRISRQLWGDGEKPPLLKLANGLDLCVIEDARLPIVSTVLAYRVGTRDELPAEAGAAHFLEHMMFKGSSKFGPGDIDRVTEANGGSNNAFTSHDVTAYYFSFAKEHWATALEIEIDRMSGLRLAAEEVDSERQVILEELAMYENDPWDVLHQEVSRLLYGDHPYGRPVLGTRSSLAALGSEELAGFHRKHYRADNAVLTVVGDVRAQDVKEWAQRMPGGAQAGPRAEIGSARSHDGVARFMRNFGEVSRLLVSFLAPSAAEATHPVARLLAVCLAGGRSSRLNKVLVEQEQLAVWVAADVTEMAGPASISIALEVTPGVEPDVVERRLFEELAKLAQSGVGEAELARAQKMTLSDWTFGHERIQRRAMTLALAASTFDPGHPERSLMNALSADVGQASELAREIFDPESATIAWSMAEEPTPSDSAGGEAVR